MRWEQAPTLRCGELNTHSQHVGANCVRPQPAINATVQCAQPITAPTTILHILTNYAAGVNIKEIKLWLSEGNSYYKGERKMSAKDKVLETMRTLGKPVSAGEIVKASGLDKAEVDNAFKELKKENAIISPMRCKWEPAE